MCTGCLVLLLLLLLLLHVVTDPYATPPRCPVILKSLPVVNKRRVLCSPQNCQCLYTGFICVLLTCSCLQRALSLQQVQRHSLTRAAGRQPIVCWEPVSPADVTLWSPAVRFNAVFR
jgi:hypothetical protein